LWPVLPIDRIKLDSTCPKGIFDSARHFAPIGFGPLVWWNSPYGYVDIVQGAVRQGWNDLKEGVHATLPANGGSADDLKEITQ
jgi:hypothetical protein